MRLVGIFYIFLSIYFAYGNNMCGNSQDDFCNHYADMLFMAERDTAFSKTLAMRDVTNLGPNAPLPAVTKPPCPSIANITNDTPFNLRSLSPWVWIKNIDRNRDPELILESECLCTHCLSATPIDQNGVNYLLKSANISIVRGIKRRQPNGIWIDEELTTNVACRCDVAEVET